MLIGFKTEHHLFDNLVTRGMGMAIPDLALQSRLQCQIRRRATPLVKQMMLSFLLYFEAYKKSGFGENGKKGHSTF